MKMTASENLRAYERIIEHIERCFAGSAHEVITKEVLKKDRALLLGLFEVVDEETLAKAIEKAKEHLL